MTDPIPDLLPDDLTRPDQPRSAVAILQAQAARLGKKTGNAILAEVERARPRFDGNKWRYAYGFNLVVPALEDYTFQAFEIDYPLSGYPVRITGAVVDGEAEARNEAELMEVLRRIFSSAEFLKVIHSLMREVSALSDLSD